MLLDSCWCCCCCCCRWWCCCCCSCCRWPVVLLVVLVVVLAVGVVVVAADRGCWSLLWLLDVSWESCLVAVFDVSLTLSVLLLWLLRCKYHSSSIASVVVVVVVVGGGGGGCCCCCCCWSCWFCGVCPLWVNLDYVAGFHWLSDFRFKVSQLKTLPKNTKVAGLSQSPKKILFDFSSKGTATKKDVGSRAESFFNVDYYTISFNFNQSSTVERATKPSLPCMSMRILLETVLTLKAARVFCTKSVPPATWVISSI